MISLHAILACDKKLPCVETLGNVLFFVWAVVLCWSPVGGVIVSFKIVFRQQLFCQEITKFVNLLSFVFKDAFMNICHIMDKLTKSSNILN